MLIASVTIVPNGQSVVFTTDLAITVFLTPTGFTLQRTDNTVVTLDPSGFSQTGDAEFTYDDTIASPALAPGYLIGGEGYKAAYDGTGNIQATNGPLQALIEMGVENLMAGAVLLDAVPRSSTGNCYPTLAEANLYLRTYRFYTGDKWDAFPDDQKRTLLIWATTTIDYCFEWNGAIRTLIQALQWPRAGIRDLSGRWLSYDVVPAAIKNATIELAYAFSQRNRPEEPAIFGYGIGEFNIEGIRVWVDKTQQLSIIPSNIALMIGYLGTQRDGAAGGISVVKLQRR